MVEQGVPQTKEHKARLKASLKRPLYERVREGKRQEASPGRPTVAYRVFEHTADIGLEVEGDTLSDLFAEAARGMFSIIRGDNVVTPKLRQKIALHSDRLDRLLVDWLEEFLYLQDAEELVFHDVEGVEVLHTGNGFQLKGIVSGEPFSHELHPGCLHVKAVTRHALVVDAPDGAKPGHLRVILDI